MSTVWHEVPVLEAYRYLGSGGIGRSMPILVQGGQGDLLHVKLKHNPQGTRTLTSEWIGNLLGQWVGAPVPEVVLVRLERSQLKDFSVLAQRRWRSGLQFGTRYLPHSERWDSGRSLAGVHNLDDLPMAALFEAWLYNTDVKNSHVLWMPDIEGGRLVVTDHGFIFPHGPNWEIEDLIRHTHRFPHINVFHAIAQSVSHPFQFGEALHRIQSVTADQLSDLMASIPSEWPLSSRRRDALIDFLLERQGDLEHLAQKWQREWHA